MYQVLQNTQAVCVFSVSACQREREREREWGPHCETEKTHETSVSSNEFDVECRVSRKTLMWPTNWSAKDIYGQRKHPVSLKAWSCPDFIRWDGQESAHCGRNPKGLNYPRFKILITFWMHFRSCSHHLKLDPSVRLHIQNIRTGQTWENPRKTSGYQKNWIGRIGQSSLQQHWPSPPVRHMGWSRHSCRAERSTPLGRWRCLRANPVCRGSIALHPGGFSVKTPKLWKSQLSTIMSFW